MDLEYGVLCQFREFANPPQGVVQVVYHQYLGISLDVRIDLSASREQVKAAAAQRRRY
jgi:hypothetical protein